MGACSSHIQTAQHLKDAVQDAELRSRLRISRHLRSSMEHLGRLHPGVIHACEVADPLVRHTADRHAAPLVRCRITRRWSASAPGRRMCSSHPAVAHMAACWRPVPRGTLAAATGRVPIEATTACLQRQSGPSVYWYAQDGINRSSACCAACASTPVAGCQPCILQRRP
jgi:hypothetical protein